MIFTIGIRERLVLVVVSTETGADCEYAEDGEGTAG